MNEEFRNNVFCRNHTNQIKANKLWLNISKNMNEQDKLLFKIEWNHYLLGELTTDEFSIFYDKYMK